MKNSTLFIWLCLLLPLSASFAQSVDVELDYWGYNFLDRCIRLGLIQAHDLAVKPISREQFFALLIEIKKKDPNQTILSATDLKILDQLENDFCDQSGCSGKSADHLNKYGTHHLNLYFKETIISNHIDSLAAADLLSESYAGLQFRGQLKSTLAYSINLGKEYVRGNIDIENKFDTARASLARISGNNLYNDQIDFQLVFTKPWLRMKLGQGNIQWGPGYHANLAVSRNQPSAGMLYLSTSINPLTFSYFHTMLHSIYGQKYSAGHRLDLKLFDGLNIGASETVIYGKRDIVLAYLIPFMPFHIAEHHLGDKDNNCISFDFNAIKWNYNLYGEFFIDDMTSTKSLTGYFGNKFAFLLGMVWTDPLQIRNLNLRGEYCRIEPYVYSHHDSINVYTHYDQVIGHWLGPNGDTIFLQAELNLGRDLNIRLAVEKIRKGEGDANTVSRPEEGVEKKFLQGIHEIHNIIGITVKQQVRRDIFINIAYAFADRKNLDLIRNNNSKDHLLRMQLAIKL